MLVALLGLTSPSRFGCPGHVGERGGARLLPRGRIGSTSRRAAHAARQRTTLLQRSLEAYVDSLRIVRSRNALFNAAIVLGELGRNDESFNYFGEYLRIEELPAETVRTRAVGAMPFEARWRCFR